MNPNNECKCDRELCSKRIFRGKHVCTGENTFDIDGGKVTMTCPCACHADLETPNPTEEVEIRSAFDVDLKPVEEWAEKNDFKTTDPVFPNPTTVSEDWRKDFINKFFVYRLDGKRFSDHVGAEKDAVKFIEEIEQKAYEKGRRDEANEDIEDDE